jgi:hypothetical protein
MWFVFDGDKAEMFDKEMEGKIVGTVKTAEGEVTLIFKTANLLMFNKTKKETAPAQLYPLLKSNLQKQIRRGEKEAITTASLMMDLDQFELLRRLSIIAAEDVILSQETSRIVWYMAAVSKRLILSEKDKKFILSYVNSLIQYPKCRRLGLRDEIRNSNLKMTEILQSNHPEKNKLAGILFRYYFGGLSGDLPMLSELCDDILQGRDLDIIIKNEVINLSSLKFSEAAIDFHIYPNLLTLIKQDTNIDENVVKSCIWQCSSRINYRFPEPTDLGLMWNKIRPSFLHHSKIYLSKIVKKYF